MYIVKKYFWLLSKVASKTKYSPFCNCIVVSIGCYIFLKQVYKVFFQQCEYCEVGIVIIEFSTSLMP